MESAILIWPMKPTHLNLLGNSIQKCCEQMYPVLLGYYTPWIGNKISMFQGNLSNQQVAQIHVG